jgi:hypothetical protein
MRIYILAAAAALFSMVGRAEHQSFTKETKHDLQASARSEAKGCSADRRAFVEASIQVMKAKGYKWSGAQSNMVYGDTILFNGYVTNADPDHKNEIFAFDRSGVCNYKTGKYESIGYGVSGTGFESCR